MESDLHVIQSLRVCNFCSQESALYNSVVKVESLSGGERGGCYGDDIIPRSLMTPTHEKPCLSMCGCVNIF